MSGAKAKILKIISDLDLNLNGKVVLTEAATGAYVVTPIIAAAAGAKVFAYTKESSYGTFEEVLEQTHALAGQFDGLDLTIIKELSPEVLKQADIVTNSGHLRPLDEHKLRYVSERAVIPYMYEAWEVRAGDVDLDYCSKRGIPVLSTNERHSNIDVFNYLGELAVKLVHDAGKCLYRNSFIIVSNNDFGPYIANYLARLCAKVGVIDLQERHSEYSENVEWLADFPNLHIPEDYMDAEAIIFTAYPFEETWIGESTPLGVEAIKKMEEPCILRFAGHLDTDYLSQHGIKYFPEIVKAGHMGVLLSSIGLDSVIRLQAGGLKAAEVYLKGESYFNNQFAFLTV